MMQETVGRPFVPGYKRPFAPSPNHFLEFLFSTPLPGAFVCKQRWRSSWPSARYLCWPSIAWMRRAMQTLDSSPPPSQPRQGNTDPSNPYFLNRVATRQQRTHHKPSSSWPNACLNTTAPSKRSSCKCVCLSLYTLFQGMNHTKFSSGSRH